MCACFLEKKGRGGGGLLGVESKRDGSEGKKCSFFLPNGLIALPGAS